MSEKLPANRWEMEEKDYPLHTCPLCNGEGSIKTEMYLEYIKKNNLPYKKSTHVIGRYGEVTIKESLENEIRSIKNFINGDR